MKKFGKVLLSSILCVCLFVLLSSSVYAADLGVDEIAGKVQSAGVTDENFAKAIAEALVATGNTDSSLYEDSAAVKATLAAFDGKIDASNRGITSINGVNMLIGASQIVLDNNYITDITPLQSSTPYAGYFYIQNNPVRVYLPSVQQETYVFANRTNWDSAIVTGQKFVSDLNLVTNGSPLKATIHFDASVDGEYYWNNLNGVKTPPYVFYSDDASAFSFEYTDEGPNSEKTNSCLVTIISPVSLTVRAYYEGYRYYTNWKDNDELDPQKHGTQMSKSPDFYYDLNVGFYTPVKQNTKTIILGGVKFVKTDADGKPLAGATYALYMDEDCTKMVGEGVTGSDGTLYFASLETGTYYLKESSAPVGYKVDENVYSVEVKAAGIKASTVFEGGYDKVTNVVSESEIELTPKWDDWDLNASEHPLVLTSGSTSTVTASGDVLAFIKNKGNVIKVLDNEISSEDLSKLNFKSSSLTVKINGETTNVVSYEAARELINNVINNAELTSSSAAIEISGEIFYEVKPEYYETVTVANESLCVFIAPSAYKKLVGRPIKEGEFGFELVGEDCAGPVDFVGYNLAAGANEDTTDVIFENTVEGEEAILRFCKVGEYNFVVKEIIPEEKEEGMRYDDKEYKVTVTVTESGDKGLKAVLAVDGKEVLTTYSTDTTTQDNEAKRGLETTSLCTIINTWTERENPKTGVPTLFSLVDLFTLAGLGVVLKKKFF